tara:strand:- start:133 stop:381 length:249 start_codon:yes stop_codon:yes gene_type:complete
MPKISELVKDLDEIKTTTWTKLSPKQRDCIKEALSKVDADKSNANFLVKFEIALESSVEKYGVSKEHIETFIDKIIDESLEE